MHGLQVDDVKTRPGRRPSGRRQEVGLVRQRLLQQRVELGAVDLDGAELLQVLGDELRVEQREAAVGQPRAQVDQRHLAGVARRWRTCSRRRTRR